MKIAAPVSILKAKRVIANYCGHFNERLSLAKSCLPSWRCLTTSLYIFKVDVGDATKSSKAKQRLVFKNVAIMKRTGKWIGLKYSGTSNTCPSLTFTKAVKRSSNKKLNFHANNLNPVTSAAWPVTESNFKGRKFVAEYTRNNASIGAISFLLNIFKDYGCEAEGRLR